MKTIVLYTDGCCSGNPGPGGYGYYAFDKENPEDNWELSKGVKNTTNQRMELVAAIAGLSDAIEKIKDRPLRIELYTDSAYLSNCIKQEWYKRWRYNGWKNAKGEPVKNQILWEELLKFVEIEQVNVKVIKVKGHAGVEYNEKADQLAREGMKNGLR